MTDNQKIDEGVYQRADELIRIGRRAVRKAQEESRRMGVPNVYSFDGVFYYELEPGILTREDPYSAPPDDAQSAL